MNRERAIQTARRSPRVARLLAASIRTAVGFTLNISISDAESAALAHDYLPSDAVRKMRDNQRAAAMHSLHPDDVRRAAIGGTILDGITKHAANSPLGWIRRWLYIRRVKAQVQRAKTDLHRELRDRRRRRNENLHSINARSIRGLLDDYSARMDDFHECLRLRQEYMARVVALGLDELKQAEAVQKLDAIVEYHLSLALDHAFEEAAGNKDGN